MTKEKISDVHYLDGRPEFNFYDMKTDNIFIDGNLKKYPLAHRYIVFHERQHKELGNDLLGQLRHEFVNDYMIYISNSITSKELRKYIKDESKDLGVNDKLTILLLNNLRFYWVIPMKFYRFVYKHIPF